MIAALVILAACNKEDDTVEPATVDYLISNEWVLTDVTSNETSIESNDTIHNFMSNGTVKIDDRTADYLRAGNLLIISEINLDEITQYKVMNVTENSLHLQSDNSNFLFTSR